MKILHTADWHIGNTFFGYDRSNEHKHFFDFLSNVIQEENVDALIVSGDVFDNPNPSSEAQRLYYDFLGRVVDSNPGIQIVIVAGNHDSAARIEAPAALLQRNSIYVLGHLHSNDNFDIALDDLIIPLHSKTNIDDEVVCLAVPFICATEIPREETFSKSMGKFFHALISEARHRYGKGKRMVMSAHFYATGSEILEDDHSERLIIGGEENVDASEFCKGLSYVALGHIHKAQRAAGLDYVRYSGSALPMSFAERNYKHGVNLVDINEEGEVNLKIIEYSPLRQLISIVQNDPLTTGSIKDIVESLPEAGKKDSEAAWPYVEVRVSTTPDSMTLNSIKEAFKGRAAILCTVRTVGNTKIDYREMEIKSDEQLKQLDPLLMAKTVYTAKYNGEEMPQPLVDKFKTALKIAVESEDNE